MKSSKANIVFVPQNHFKTVETSKDTLATFKLYTCVGVVIKSCDKKTATLAHVADFNCINKHSLKITCKKIVEDFQKHNTLKGASIQIFGGTPIAFGRTHITFGYIPDTHGMVFRAMRDLKTELGHNAIVKNPLSASTISHNETQSLDLSVGESTYLVKRFALPLPKTEEEISSEVSKYTKRGTQFCSRVIESVLAEQKSYHDVLANINPGDRDKGKFLKIISSLDMYKLKDFVMEYNKLYVKSHGEYKSFYAQKDVGENAAKEFEKKNGIVNMSEQALQRS